MLEKAEYLRFRKRGTACAQCGASLLDLERHPSMLVETERTAEAGSEELAAAEASPPEENRSAAEIPSDAREVSSSDLPPEEPAAGKNAEDEEDAGFHRFDYCEKCWAEKKEKAFFSYWVGRRTPTDLPPRKLNRAERNTALLALFDSLSEKNDPESDYAPHLFFLAHLLMKFRIFKWQPSEIAPKTGEKTLRFLRADSEDPVLVPDTHMPDEMIVQLKEEIESYLRESTGQVIRL